MGHTAYLLDLPVTDYRDAHKLQQSVVTARHSGRLDRDLVMMLEHAPVFTLGRRGGSENLLVSPDWLDARSIELVPIERGGDITYHGPGQLVVYVFINLSTRGMGVADFVCRMEAAIVKTAAHWGIDARGDETERGAWTDSRKLGSVGITVRRGVTFHGLALNVGIDLEPFQWINPCGLKGCEMTSLEKETGREIEMAAVRRQMAFHLGDVFEMALTPMVLGDLTRWLRLGSS